MLKREDLSAREIPTINTSVLERQIQQTRASLESRISFVEHAVSEGFANTRDSFTQVNNRIDQLVTRFDAHGHADTKSSRT